MHICHVCPYDLSIPGGVRTHIVQLCSTLERKGHKVTIIGCSNNNDHGIALRVLDVAHSRRVPIWGTTIDFIVATRKDKQKLLHYLTDEAPDVVHFHTPWTPILSWQVLRWSRAVNKVLSSRPDPIKLVATFHDSPPDSLLGKFLGSYVMPFAARSILPLFDAVISVSEVQKPFIAKWSNVNVRVIPNGFSAGRGEVLVNSHKEKSTNADRNYEGNPDQFISPDDSKEPKNPDYQNNPIELNSPDNPNIIEDPSAKTILFLGRLEARKGLLDAIKVLKLVQRLHPNTRLLVAGEGAERGAAEELIREEGVGGITFLGQVSDHEKKLLFAQADVYIAPALYGESFGIVLLEAMSYGTPVVGYGNPGYLSVAKGYDLENFPPPGDVDALAERVSRLFMDPTWRQELIEKGKLHAANFDWDIISQEILQLYETL